MPTHRHQTGVAAIALFKMGKGLLALLVSLSLFKVVHAEIATLFSLLIETLHLNPGSHLIHALTLKVDALQPHSMLIAGSLSLAYAGLSLVEGVGLWLELSWAAYLTVLSTSLLVPFELYEIIERLSVLRLVVLLLNLFTLAFLISQLRRHALRTRTHHSPAVS
jgi:uncharacterized membrane protein (DUF2068 family)